MRGHRKWKWFRDTFSDGVLQRMGSGMMSTNQSRGLEREHSFGANFLKECEEILQIKLKGVREGNRNSVIELRFQIFSESIKNVLKCVSAGKSWLHHSISDTKSDSRFVTWSVRYILLLWRTYCGWEQNRRGSNGQPDSMMTKFYASAANLPSISVDEFRNSWVDIPWSRQVLFYVV
jgi:hypothetical protein